MQFKQAESCKSVLVHLPGALLLEDISSSAILRAERDCATALNNSFKSFHLQVQNFAAEEAGENRWFISCIAFSSDATNSGIWQRSKLQAAEVVSTHFPVAALRNGRFVEVATRRVGWSDVAVVLHSTAAGLNVLLQKQLSILGAPTWR